MKDRAVAVRLHVGYGELRLGQIDARQDHIAVRHPQVDPFGGYWRFGVQEQLDGDDAIVQLLEDTLAASAVSDGSGDNGIDAFYFDGTEKIAYIVQSKWIHSGNGSVEVGEIQKFVQGCKDLLEARFERFTGRFRKREAEVMSVLEDSLAKFVLVIAYPGLQSLSDAAKRPLEFKGSTDVNEGITETLRSAPEKFWYFNNGITVLCSHLGRKPMGGTRRATAASGDSRSWTAWRSSTRTDCKYRSVVLTLACPSTRER